MLTSARLTKRAIEDISCNLLSEPFEKIISGLDNTIEQTCRISKDTHLEEVTATLQVRADVGFGLVGNVLTGARGSVQIRLKIRSLENKETE